MRENDEWPNLSVFLSFCPSVFLSFSVFVSYCLSINLYPFPSISLWIILVLSFFYLFTSLWVITMVTIEKLGIGISLMLKKLNLRIFGGNLLNRLNSNIDSVTLNIFYLNIANIFNKFFLMSFCSNIDSKSMIIQWFWFDVTI